MRLPIPYDVLLRVAQFAPDSNAWALELTLEEMADQDRFRPIDYARIASVRMLARAVDADTCNASLWAQYRAALKELMSDGAADDDGFAKLLAQLQGDAKVGDTAPA